MSKRSEYKKATGTDAEYLQATRAVEQMHRFLCSVDEAQPPRSAESTLAELTAIAQEAEWLDPLTVTAAVSGALVLHSGEKGKPLPMLVLIGSLGAAQVDLYDLTPLAFVAAVLRGECQNMSEILQRVRQSDEDEGEMVRCLLEIGLITVRRVANLGLFRGTAIALLLALHAEE